MGNPRPFFPLRVEKISYSLPDIHGHPPAIVNPVARVHQSKSGWLMMATIRHRADTHPLDSHLSNSSLLQNPKFSTGIFTIAHCSFRENTYFPSFYFLANYNICISLFKLDIYCIYVNKFNQNFGFHNITFK